MAATAAIQIGELSRRTSCNIETIRYYERIGLLPVPPRRGRYRSYGREDVARLGFVRRARELGFTLDEVRALLGLAAGGQASCTEVRELARRICRMCARDRGPQADGTGSGRLGASLRCRSGSGLSAA
ncbi:MerR family transcriptional regulator [Sphingobium sp. DEHP117]|nr:MerR family transcriptional regulator [Sphingobium sp. DEHP117]MDQ4421915.1 MerR family transcriptional regulator [Sphingobium sp. DEHP117]